MQTRDLFEMPADTRREQLAPGAWLLHGFAYDQARVLLAAVKDIEHAAPFRHLVTPGGFRMSVAMTNCGSLGWMSDAHGYRYTADDPQSGRPWPPMPPAFLQLAQAAAEAGGFSGFKPDACLLNRYEPGARLTLHQDKDERDFGAPIVSVSLGLPAVFLFGGPLRKIGSGGCPCSTATSWSGAVPRGCTTTACSRSKTGSTKSWAGCA